MRLYHFTCACCEAEIRATGLILPNHHPMLGKTLAWFTSDPRAKGAHLGMSRLKRGSILRCDRTEFRFAVDTETAIPWNEYKSRFDEIWGCVHDLEAVRGTRPSTWWVAENAIPILTEEESA